MKRNLLIAVAVVAGFLILSPCVYAATSFADGNDLNLWVRCAR